MLAALHVKKSGSLIARPKLKSVFNSTSKAHPGADYVMNKANPWYVGGRLEGCSCPRTMTSALCGSLRLNCGRNLPDWAGAGSSPSRPAIPCTAPIRN